MKSVRCCGRNFILLLAWMMFPLHATPAAVGAPALSAEIDRLLREQDLPGIVWSAYVEGNPLTGANGMADLSTTRPMTLDTRVQVGSVAKTVLALGVLRLISEDRLSLGTDVEQLLPMLDWDNPWRNKQPVTVRHLLEHTAGLDNIRLWQFLNSQVTADTPLLDAFPADRGRLLRVRTRPGSQYSYSNMGYALLGLVIEQITQRRYEDYLAQALLSPLRMGDSSFHFITQEENSRLAMGYLDAGAPQPAVPMYLRPAGQFTTTATDMLRLIAFMLGDGSIDGSPFLSAELMTQLGRPSTTTAHEAGLAIGHGLALASRDRHGVLGYCHPGTTFGFRAYLCLFPEEGKGFFYGINADNETADYESFNRLFIEHLAVTPVPPVGPTAAAGKLSVYAGLYTMSPNNMAQFAWLDWMFNSIWLSEDVRGGRLVIHSLQQPERRLLPLGDGLFRDAERRLASHVFLDDRGTVLSNGLMTWRRASPVPLVLSWVSLVSGVLGLVYLPTRCSWLLIRRNWSAGGALLLPYLGSLAFLLPAFLYSGQNFLEFGEKTAASVLVAILSGALPLLLAVSMVQLLKSRQRRAADLLAVAASLQLTLVLLYQGVLPVRFWV